MPQIQILDPVPNFQTELAKNLGQGFNKGLEKGIASGLSKMLQTKKQISKVPSALKAAFGKDFDKLDPQARLKLIEEANAATQELGDAHLASQYIANNYFNPQPNQSKQKNKGQLTKEKDEDNQVTAFFRDMFEGAEEFVPSSWEQAWEDVKGASAQAVHGVAKGVDFIPDAQNAIKYGVRKLFSKIKGESDEEFWKNEDRLEAETKAEEKKLGHPLPLSNHGTKLSEYVDQKSGGRGQPRNAADRTIQAGLGAGPPGAAVQGAKEVQDELGIELPAPVQAALDAFEYVVAIKSGKNIKLPSLKANKRILSNAERVAAETGMKVEEVIEKARQESGADLQKAQAGDATEINKLNNRITKQAPGSEKVTKTEKTVFNPKAAIKQREAFAEKVKDSPIADYLAAERAVEHRPETIAKQKEIIETNQPKITKLEKDIAADKADLRQMQLSRKEHSGNALERIESNILHKERSIQKKMDELKDLQYEMKYFRKRPTEAEIDLAVKKSAEAIVEEARNPTAEGQKAIERQLELDKKYIEKAQKLIERGELPGDLYPDTHIKMKQKYLDGYQAMIRELQQEIRSLKNAKDAASLQKIAQNKTAIEQLQKRAKRLESDIVNHKDKLKAVRALEGPSGAFYKNQMKGMHQDLAQFKHDFFKYHKDKTVKQQITEKTAEPAIKETGKKFEEAKKAAQKAAENPTKENVKEVADKTGTSEKSVAEVFEEVHKATEKAEQGTATDADAMRLAKNLHKWAAGGALAGITGVFQALAEHEWGFKPKASWIRLFTGEAISRVPILGHVYDFVREGLEQKTAQTISDETRGKVRERFEAIKKLREKYSTSKANRILKVMQEIERESLKNDYNTR